MRPSSAIVMVAVVTLSACVSSIPHPEPSDLSIAKTRYADATIDELEHGRAEYVAKCAGCHQLYVPSTRRPESWPLALDEMSTRAKLKPDQRASIERYLVTIAAR